MLHEFKIWPNFFEAVDSGIKPFDVRRLDPLRKPVDVGDEVVFREWDPDAEPSNYTGRQCGKVVTYVLHGDGSIFPFGYFVMGLRSLKSTEFGIEYVDRCAIIREGKIYSLNRPARHPDIIRFMVEECSVQKPVNGTHNGGFISNTGRYLNRTEAFQVAKFAGQIRRRLDGILASGPELSSEDLW